MISLASVLSCPGWISLAPKEKYMHPVELYNKSLKRTGPLMGLSVGTTKFGLVISDVNKKYALRRSRRTLCMTENIGSALQTLEKYVHPVELYNESLKRTGPLMGLSVGTTKLGLVISDVNKKYALRRSRRTLYMTENIGSALQTLISKHSVSGLVIGFPYFGDLRIMGMQANHSDEELIETRKFEDVSYTLLDDYMTLKLMQAKHFVEELIERKFEDVPYTLLDDYMPLQMLSYASNAIVKSANCFPILPKALSVENAAYEILEEYLDVFTQGLDPNFDLRILLACEVRGVMFE